MNENGRGHRPRWPRKTIEIRTYHLLLVQTSQDEEEKKEWESHKKDASTAKKHILYRKKDKE